MIGLGVLALRNKDAEILVSIREDILAIESTSIKVFVCTIVYIVAPFVACFGFLKGFIGTISK